MKSKPYLELRGILSGTPAIPLKAPGKYVYQRTKKGLGNVPEDRTDRQQCRRHVIGTLRHTVKQQPYRLRFALGVETWRGMTEPQKEEWRIPSRKLHLNRFQGFMRNWGRTRHTPTGSTWDTGLTIWDTGLTTWDIPSPTFWDAGATFFDLSLTTFDTPKATVFDGNATTWDNDTTYFFN